MILIYRKLYNIYKNRNWTTGHVKLCLLISFLVLLNVNAVKTVYTGFCEASKIE